MIHRYIVNDVAYAPGVPRVFLAFEDRQRDLSGLLEFGTVLQLFPSRLKWQLTTETVPDFLAAVQAFFKAHDFTEQDAIAALGDPVAIAILVTLAAKQNAGRARVLRWDRRPCEACGKHWTVNAACADHAITGRYIPVEVVLPK